MGKLDGGEEKRNYIITTTTTTSSCSKTQAKARLLCHLPTNYQGWTLFSLLLLAVPEKKTGGDANTEKTPTSPPSGDLPSSPLPPPFKGRLRQGRGVGGRGVRAPFLRMQRHLNRQAGRGPRRGVGDRVAISLCGLFSLLRLPVCGHMILYPMAC